jgi:hypothetical protein
VSEGIHDGAVAETAGGKPRSVAEIRAEIEQTREQLGATVEALAEKTDIKARAQHRIEAAKETVVHSVGAARETVSSTADGFLSRAREATPESAGAGMRQVRATAQQRPLPFAAAGAFAAGLLVGWVLVRR